MSSAISAQAADAPENSSESEDEIVEVTPMVCYGPRDMRIRRTCGVTCASAGHTPPPPPRRRACQTNALANEHFRSDPNLIVWGNSLGTGFRD